jgi:hypothetical protein
MKKSRFQVRLNKAKGDATERELAQSYKEFGLLFESILDKPRVGQAVTSKNAFGKQERSFPDMKLKGIKSGLERAWHEVKAGVHDKPHQLDKHLRQCFAQNKGYHILAKFKDGKPQFSSAVKQVFAKWQQVAKQVQAKGAKRGFKVTVHDIDRVIERIKQVHAYVKENKPELAEKVKSGQMHLLDAYKQVRRDARQQQKPAPSSQESNRNTNQEKTGAAQPTQKVQGRAGRKAALPTPEPTTYKGRILLTNPKPLVNLEAKDARIQTPQERGVLSKPNQNRADSKQQAKATKSQGPQPGAVLSRSRQGRPASTTTKDQARQPKAILSAPKQKQSPSHPVGETAQVKPQPSPVSSFKPKRF